MIKLYTALFFFKANNTAHKHMLMAALRLFFIFNFSFLIVNSSYAQVAGDYQSNLAGTWNWSNVANWQRYNGSAWVAATDYPGQSVGAGSVTILDAHNVNLDVTPAFPIANLTMAVTVTNTTLGFNPGVSLQVTNLVTFSGPTKNGISTQLNVGFGHLTCGTFTMTDPGNNNRQIYTNISFGSVNVLGDMTLTSTNARNFFSIMGTGTVRLGGNYTSGGAMFALSTSSHMEYNGSGNQTLVPNVNYANLIINKPSGTLTATTPFSVTDTLSLNGGQLITSATNILTMDTNSRILGGSNASFINGPMIYKVQKATPVSCLFPVGKNNQMHLAELNITHTSATATSYTAEYINTSAAALGWTLPGTMDKISTTGYWTISTTAGATVSAASVRLHYDEVDGVKDLSNLLIAKGNASAWTDIGGSAIGIPTGNVLSTTNFTTFSNFALANKNGGSNSLIEEIKYRVTNNADAGAGSLRQAIIDANAHAGLDSIVFRIPSNDVAARTIVLVTALPTVTGSVIIDGTSQASPAFGNSNAKIILNGNATIANGLYFSTTNCELYGMCIYNFKNYGVNLSYAHNTKIGGNLKGNVISGNGSSGNGIYNYGSRNMILYGNIIGLDTSGMVAWGAQQTAGVLIGGPADTILIGGSAAWQRNIISANLYGIYLQTGIGVNNVQIKGNFIGCDKNMSGSVGNYRGFNIGGGTNITIGGLLPGEKNIIYNASAGNNSTGIYIYGGINHQIIGNVISGNGSSGYGIYNSAADNIKIYGNIIGLDTAGLAGWGAQQNGIFVTSGSDSVRIGGKEAWMKNIISKNNTGISISGLTGNDLQIKGNWIGTDKNMGGAVGNVLNGISISTSSNINIGGLANGEMNIIYNNGSNGIYLNNSSKVAIIRNTVSGNSNSSSWSAIDISNTDNVNVWGNIIGLDTAGINKWGNSLQGGIYVRSGSDSIQIGGNQLWQRNIICGNRNGFQTDPTFIGKSLKIQGNYFGINKNMSAIVGNTLCGITIYNSSATLIGGSSSEGNIICGSQNAGLSISGSSVDSISCRKNIFFNNSKTSGNGGINLSLGANKNIASPVITLATFSKIMGTAQANDTIELFADTTAKNEGSIYIGQTTADASGAWSFTGTYDGDFVATATDALGNTSMFSATATCAPFEAAFDYQLNDVTKTIVLTDTSAGNVNEILWDLGDGTYSNDSLITHKFDEEGFYDIALTVVNEASGEQSQTIKTIQVGSNGCNALFNMLVDTATRTVSFTNISMGNPNKFYWLFGDGQSSEEENPVYTYPVNGIYTPSLHILNTSTQCVSERSAPLNLEGNATDCEADFSYVSRLNNNEVLFYSKSVGDNINSYTWNFNDGSMSTTKHATHQYSKAGAYTVCLSIESSTCKNITCKPVKTGAGKSLFAQFVYTIDSAQKSLYIKNRSTGALSLYTWDFGDMNASTLASPQHMYADSGMYQIVLTVEDSAGKKSHAGELINVHSKQKSLQAFFFANEKQSEGGKGVLPIEFKGAGYGEASEVEWDFGDSETETTTIAPTHQYATAGSYPVCLTVKNPLLNQTYTFCKTITVNDVVTNLADAATLTDQFELYPNPAKSELIINNEKLKMKNGLNTSISITNTLGQDVFHSSFLIINSSLQIDVSQFSPGTYFLKLTTDNGVAVKKFVKQ